MHTMSRAISAGRPQEAEPRVVPQPPGQLVGRIIAGTDQPDVLLQQGHELLHALENRYKYICICTYIYVFAYEYKR